MGKMPIYSKFEVHKGCTFLGDKEGEGIHEVYVRLIEVLTQCSCEELQF